MLYSILKSIKYSLQDFYRNIFLSVATIFIIFLSLISISILIVLNILAQETINSFKEKVDISLYFKPEITQNEVSSLKQKIEALGLTKETRIVSKEEALEEFRQKHKENPAILESLEELEENPFGFTLILKAKSLNDYPLLLSFINSQVKDIIWEKKFEEEYQEVISKLNDISKKINRIGLVTVSIFIIISILVIFNAIRLMIYSRREEIAIMRLVGATNSFIKAPFLLNSFYYSFFAWLINLIVLYFSLNLIQPRLIEFLGYNFDLISFLKQNFPQIFGIQLIFISLISLISSQIAIRKYLRI